MSFLARHNPLAIVPVAILFGGIVASGGLIERRMGSSRRHRPGAAGPDLRRAADVGNAVRPLQDIPGARSGRSHMSQSAYLIVLVALIGGALRVSTPFMFVALGECLTEKSGRVNLGLEGTLVLGAMTGYAISYHTGSPWLGVLGRRLRRLGARRDARLYLQAAARERHRGRHRHDAVRHRRRVLLRQALHPAVGAAARLVLARRLDRQPGDRDRAADQSAADRRHRRRRW